MGEKKDIGQDAMFKWGKWSKAVIESGFDPEKKSREHWQIRGGPMLVNYYPFARKGPKAYVAGTTGGTVVRCFEDLLAMAQTAPPTGGVAGKDTRRSNYKTAKRRMLNRNPHCWVCGRELDESTATLDHYIPLHRGGLDNHNNWRLACEECNRRRGSDMPELEQESTP